jgi:PAS domain S-box-containing protein
MRWLAPTLLGLAALSAALAFACISLISAARAYVGGESQWSRAQKTASQALLRYADSGRAADWDAYLRAIQVPLGDRRAREELDKPQPDMAVVHEGFVAGAIDPDDVAGMARLYRWFGSLPFMAEAIAVWSEGDTQIAALDDTAQAIRAALQQGAAAATLAPLRARVHELEDRLTPLEARFSATIGGSALFRSLWETTNDAVLIVGTQHLIQFANPAAHELLGYSPGTLIGQPLSLLQPAHLRAAHVSGVARYLASGERRLDWRGTEIVALHRDGRELPMEIRFAQFDLDGEIHFVGFLRDIAERKRAEAEIREAQQRLEQRVAERTHELSQANQRLLELDRLKSEFLATMSHELRTPLNSILGFTDLLRKGLAGPVNAEQQRQLDFVHGSGRHLLALINDLLDLSRIESGRMEVAHEEFEFGAVVEDVAAQLRPLAQRKQLALVLEVPRPLSWRGDRRKVYQVLLNLVGNALKFTEQGEVRVRGAVSHEGLAVEVRDSGIGIAADQLPHLFQAFRQIDSGIGRSHDGSGLGLYLTRKLLELMGGRIEVESAPAVGSTFRIVLPGGAGAA